MSETGENVELGKLVEELHASQKRLVAALRERGGKAMTQPYAFVTPEGKTLTLSELFGGKRDLLVVHNMGEACPYCMMWADGLSSSTGHLSDRAAFWLTNNDPVEQLGAYREKRGWAFPVDSCRGTSFTADCGFGKEGDWWPGVSAFWKDESGGVVRVASTFFGPGDLYNPVWHLFDLLKEGARGWAPKRAY